MHSTLCAAGPLAQGSRKSWFATWRRLRPSRLRQRLDFGKVELALGAPAGLAFWHA
jgi:hypothetical protein